LDPVGELTALSQKKKEKGKKREKEKGNGMRAPPIHITPLTI